MNTANQSEDQGKPQAPSAKLQRAISGQSPRGPERRRFEVWRLELFWSLVMGAWCVLQGGCCTAPPMAQVNLKQPGWTVHTGQAVWHLPNGSREVAGEVLVATRSDGENFVQFSKSPFPLVVAQSSPQGWQAGFPPQNKHYSGRGKPPKRLLWLWLPRLLEGQPPPRHWSWHEDANGWEVKNPANGESLEGYFNG